MSPEKAKGGGSAAKDRVTFQVSTESRPDFDRPLVAFAFDRNGSLLDRADVKSGKVTLGIPEKGRAHARVFVAPAADELDAAGLTADRLARLGAYEPVLLGDDGLLDRIRIPGDLIDIWPFCFCWVRGRVVRSSDGRPVCDARVHICEADRIPRWILELPELDILRLRDDLIDVLRNPPIPLPPVPEPDPFPPFPGPGPDPAPFERALFRLSSPGQAVGFNPQPEPPGSAAGFNPQPEPPGSRVGFNPQPEPPKLIGPMFRPRPTLEPIEIDPGLRASLLSPSSDVVRRALAGSWTLLVPWLCHWPWWWWRFRCDEVAVRTTDAQGRFEAIVFYPCGGDRPDLYFWVEYDFGGGFETVHRPPLPCNIHWDYACGTEVTIQVSDPRIPGCDPEPDLDGCQVVIKSIGNQIAVRELQTSSAGPAHEGLTAGGRPLGASLELRVDFGRTCLIDTKKIPYYRWSYRRLSGPGGTGGPTSGWTPLSRDVYRHYRVGTSYPSEPMGPLPTTGPGAAPLPNLFKIRPVDPPTGNEWVVWNEHVDLATAYFDTHLLPGVPTSGPTSTGPAPDDTAAGRYELKLELFDETGDLVNWTDEGIDLRIPEQNAPFGTTTITTEPAPAYNRVVEAGSGDTLGFRMVVRIDNNRCYAEIFPVAGDVPPDPACGFHEYASLTDDARLSFVARHPNRFATYAFGTRRAAGSNIGAASTSGVAGEPGTNGFLHTGGFTYEKDVAVGTLLGSCDQAAFAETLHVVPMVTNGYSTINGYRHDDAAAFALAKPCEPCECDDGPPGQGVGGGRGPGGGG